jgi:hypothetical protein
MIIGEFSSFEHFDRDLLKDSIHENNEFVVSIKDF